MPDDERDYSDYHSFGHIRFSNPTLIRTCQVDGMTLEATLSFEQIRMQQHYMGDQYPPD